MAIELPDLGEPAESKWRKYARSKALWTGVAMIASAGGMYAAGQASAADAIQQASTGLLGIFIRVGIFKLEM